MNKQRRHSCKGSVIIPTTPLEKLSASLVKTRAPRSDRAMLEKDLDLVLILKRSPCLVAPLLNCVAALPQLSLLVKEKIWVVAAFDLHLW